MLAAGGLLLVVGCSGPGSSGANTGSPASEGTAAFASLDQSGSVDPQILSDVVAGAFPTPGDAKRTIHVQLAARSIANVACGGRQAPDLNDTSGRFYQPWFADLGLIRERGLSERSETADGAWTVDVGPCVETALPSYQDWFDLAAPWQEIALTASQSRAVVATEPGVSDCLGRRSGLDVDKSGVTASYLLAVDAYLSGLKASEEELQQELRRLSDVFVECSGDYYSAMGDELEPQREMMIERNRELLVRFAGELAAQGYVP